MLSIMSELELRDVPLGRLSGVRCAPAETMRRSARCRSCNGVLRTGGEEKNRDPGSKSWLFKKHGEVR